jgi:hypothetical protein
VSGQALADRFQFDDRTLHKFENVFLVLIDAGPREREDGDKPLPELARFWQQNYAMFHTRGDI